MIMSQIRYMSNHWQTVLHKVYCKKLSYKYVIYGGGEMMFGFCQPRRVAPVAHVPRRDDTTIAVILVLFILLVIVGCACVKH